MGRTYKTMQGRSIDMDKLRSQNELTPAVGNMKVNARGDEIGPGGKIIRTREQVVSSYYEVNPKATPDVDTPSQQSASKPQAVNNPPSQPMRVEDTPVSSVIEDAPEKHTPVVPETQILDKGADAVKKARARRKGIEDATGGN